MTWRSKVKLIDYAFKQIMSKLTFYLFVCFVVRTLVFLPINNTLTISQCQDKKVTYVNYLVTQLTIKKIYVLEFPYKILHLIEDSVYQLEVIAYVSQSLNCQGICLSYQLNRDSCGTFKGFLISSESIEQHIRFYANTLVLKGLNDKFKYHIRVLFQKDCITWNT